jgi:pimeloyl-ACP methyl ester carboxylesterase
VLIPVGDVELAVASYGTGVPLLLLHGFTGAADDWAGVIDDLSLDRQVLTVEHRGHGDSTNTGDAATYTFDQLVTDFAGVVDRLDLERFDLLGHSMGGIVAMRYALAHPERLRSLVLMDTAGAASPEGPASGFMRAGLDLARDGGMLAVYDAIAPYLGEGADGDTARADLRRKYERMDPVAFTTLGEELQTHASVLDRLARLDLPTTVMVGEMDGLRGEADDLAATIPGAVLQVIPGAAHSPQVENRKAWLDVVNEHLALRP